MNKIEFFLKYVGLPLLVFASIIFIIFGKPDFSEAETTLLDYDSIYLSDVEWESSTGEVPQKDFSAEGNTITLTDNNLEVVEFEKGIRTHANSEIGYDVSKLNYKYLTTWVGVDRWANNSSASVQFKIYVDDELRYESNMMKKTTPMEYARVDITGAQTLKLIVNDRGDGNSSDYGNWAETQLHATNPVRSNTEDVKKYEGMDLVFNDEFYSDEIDNEKWGFATTPENGTHRYANVVGEEENIWVEDGNLNIQAKKYEGDENYSTTSAAVSTENKFDFRYGRIDVRAKVPTENGMWPAIWMMPANPDYEWPMEGEIDIMELISDHPNKIWSTIHSGVSQTDYFFKEGGTITKNRGTYYDDYHVYSMKWEPEVMSFYVDDNLVAEIDDWKNWVVDSETGEIKEREYPAPFDQNFFLKLNLATGGWSQDVDETTRWGDRTTMKVDYVRVYQENTPPHAGKPGQPPHAGEPGSPPHAQN